MSCFHCASIRDHPDDQRRIDLKMIELLPRILSLVSDITQAARTDPDHWTESQRRVAYGSLTTMAGMISAGVITHLLHEAVERLRDVEAQGHEFEPTRPS